MKSNILISYRNNDGKDILKNIGANNPIQKKFKILKKRKRRKNRLKNKK